MLITYLLVAIIGLIAGGIINVLSDDLPDYRWPRSPRYPDGTPRPPSAWLGITAFLLGQRTSPAGSKLSWRYPLAEVATIIGMIVTVAVKQSVPDVSDTQLVFWLFYIAVFVLITVIDLEHKLILFAVIIPSCVVAILDALVTPVNHEPDLGDALFGGALGFGVFFLLYIGGYVYLYIVNQAGGRNINEVAFGYGDVMLATLSGLILGWQAVIFAMFITVFLGAAGALLWMLSRRLSGTGYSMFTALPYGPYIVAGTVIMLLFSSEVRYFLVGY
jgi:prepilin signal peptidase PulO-like enzyme (type II secretory pathway)